MARSELLSTLKGIAIFFLVALALVVPVHHGLKTLRNGAESWNGRKNGQDTGSSADMVETPGRNPVNVMANQKRNSHTPSAMSGSNSVTENGFSLNPSAAVSGPVVSASPPSLKVRTKKSTEADGRCLGIFVDDCADVSGQCSGYYTSVPNESGPQLFKQCGGGNSRGILSRGGCQAGEACSGRALRCAWKCMDIVDHALVFPSTEFFAWYNASNTDVEVCMLRANIECAKLLPSAVDAKVKHGPQHSKNTGCGGKLDLSRGPVNSKTESSTGCSANLMDQLPTKKHQNMVTHVKVEARMRSLDNDDLQEQIMTQY